MINKKKSIKNMYLSISGLFTSIVGTRIYFFVLGFYILNKTGSSLNFSVSILVGTLPLVLLSPIAGAIADRYDRKKLIVGFDALSGIFMIACYLVHPYFKESIVFLYVSILILSVLNTFFSVAMQAAIPNITHKEHLIKMNSYRSMATSFAAIVSPVVGGFLFNFIDIRIFMLINGLSFMFSAFTEAFIYFKESTKERDQVVVGPIQKIKEGFSYIKKREDIKVLSKVFAIVNFIFSGFNVVIAVIFINDLGLNSATFGTVESFLFVGMLVSAMVIGQLNLNISLKKSIFIVLPIIATCTLLIGLPSSGIFRQYSVLAYTIYFAILVFTIGFTVTGLNIPARYYLQSTISEEYLGRVSGFISSITQFFIPLGTIIFGVLLDYFNSFAISLIISGLLFVYSLYLYYNVDIQEETVVQEQPAAN